VVSGDQDIASKEQRLISIFNMVPLYIMLAAFIAGMGLSVDSTAGERERKSLEPLLVNPVLRLHLIQGKWLAASFFAAIGMISTMILSLIAMLNAPLEEIGFVFTISIEQIILLILATLPLPFLATSLEMLLGIFAKSFKDAQSYIGLVTLMPTLPFIIHTFNPVPIQDWMYAIPVFGQYLLMTEVLGAVELHWLAYLSSGISCLLLSVLLCMLTSRLLARETVITG
jgi:sodium transport system permease protein